MVSLEGYPGSLRNRAGDYSLGARPEESAASSDEYDPESDVEDGRSIGSLLLKKPAMGCCLCIAILVLIVCIKSLDSVPPLHVGITYNLLNKVADTSQVWKPGRHFIGPVKSFILFPSNVQNIEFTNEPVIESVGERNPPLTTRTKDGQPMDLQVSLQYQLEPDMVGEMYSLLNVNYASTLVSKVREIIIGAGESYVAKDLWERRALFGTKLQEDVNKELKTVYASCWGLQLMIIDLQDSFEDRLVQTQVQNQKIILEEKEMEAQRIIAATGALEAKYDSDVKIILAEGQKNYTVVTQMAEANATQNVLKAQVQATSTMKSSQDGPGFNGAGLVRYQLYDALQEKDHSPLYYGFGEGSSMVTR